MKRAFLLFLLALTIGYFWTTRDTSPRCNAIASFDGHTMTLSVEADEAFSYVRVTDVSERVGYWVDQQYTWMPENAAEIGLYAEFNQNFQMSEDKDAERVILEMVEAHGLDIDYVVMIDGLTYATPNAVAWSNFGQNDGWDIAPAPVQHAGVLHLNRDAANHSNNAEIVLQYSYFQQPTFTVEAMMEWEEDGKYRFSQPECGLVING